ncbi:MAG: class I SAM-dependent methyltransferase [Hoeflea sp.]|uniref:class I SAM-dependent methyltransferase n=1 Tax=Hoeflea sp. TaxID=1940281 RepID=UPI001E09956B|nr:class I SAM-dependent methyltransferase [Hoeflea sp.]MBU4527332.1 class I SAM-dependent methyltransferase [Alphaproteobacteria bacterium]MBU4546885.1 class I SAM-dependent methyltransferase [Alphaproteobacteria bacterium]MBU4551603.1 class I SAM-dependent methyltransferase [Alphaproteobacteria bacterium]MBV1725608.1 class I SAM-dependent methyltransferase [Hoeflea sp.]MBV1759656.1 class I SAM-dependent methyltransferase [Hoeflea sp.]
MHESNIPTLADLATRTVDVYERNAARFDSDRTKVLIEKTWLDRFAALLPPGGTILDAGCGAGDPIARYLSSLGHRVTGVDAAHAMIDLARKNFPGGDWRQADLRHLDLDETFDGVIGWDSFFHLTPQEQRTTLVRLASHLEPKGVLMLTVGPEAGEVAGRVGDDPVYHSSLSLTEYQAVLEGLGLRILQFVRQDPDCGFHTVLLACKQ